MTSFSYHEHSAAFTIGKMCKKRYSRGAPRSGAVGKAQPNADLYRPASQPGLPQQPMSILKSPALYRI